MKPEIRSLWDFPLNEMRELFKNEGFSSFSADQIFHWAYKKSLFKMEDWGNVSKKVKEYINENLVYHLPKVVWHGLSADGTRKFLVSMGDGNTVETVVIPGKDRLTLCISSQVGCAIGCTFCHTGTMGLKRHLYTSEIVGQFMAVTRWLKDKVGEETRLTNIVYMGQGEPLHNFENVKKATQIFLDDKGYGLSQRKVTLSTSGLIPQIEKLWDFPPVNIAISLHAAHDNIRSELMPINKVYDLKKLFEAIRSVPIKAHRRITYEYLLIKDLNDRKEDIDGLVDLLDRQESKVNIIPFNEYPNSEFKRPSSKKVEWFKNELQKRGLICTVRATKGDDILAACGQLKSAVENKLNTWDDQVLKS